MELKLIRKDANDKRTIGDLNVDGKSEPDFNFHTLEDVIRPAGEKIHGQTAIPPGRYRVVVDYSNRFKKKLAHLLDVPNFAGIRIHSGNVAADTEGCILVGKTHGTDDVLQSRYALSILQPKIERAIERGEEVWITITNPPAVEA